MLVKKHFMEQLYIKWLKGKNSKKCDGGAGMFILGMICMIFLLVVFGLLYTYYSVYLFKFSIDDALITSLVASSAINTEEYGASHQVVIFENMTTRDNPLNDPSNMDANDSYLQSAYNNFIECFKQNLNLNDDMTTNFWNVHGAVNVEEFNVYNMYRVFDAAGNVTSYRIYRYVYSAGNWMVVPYGVDEMVSVSNSLDGSTTEIVNTTVSARLSFDIQFLPKLSELLDNPELDEKSHSVYYYHRLVDVDTMY